MIHTKTPIAASLTRLLLVTLATGALCACSSSRSTKITTKESQFRQLENPTSIFPNTYTSYSGKSGMTTSPHFSMYGELPKTSAGSHASVLPYEAVENIEQVSFSPIGADFDPSISRDGRWVYYSSTQHKPTADIYAKSVKGTAVVQLTTDPAHDVNPALSPDGKRIAFASNRSGSWDIYLMNAEGGQAVQITQDSSQELHPTWSPDGHQIAFCRMGEQSDRWEIWTTEVARPAVRRFVTYGLFPEWHPTENTIMFQRSRERGDRFFSVWTVSLDSGDRAGATEVVSSPVAAIINPSWSPNGSWIAFSTVFDPPSPDGPERPDFADVWIMRADGSARANLTGGWFVNLMPTWGPDDSVFFISDRSGFDNIWKVGAEEAIVAAGSPSATAPEFANVPTDD